MLCLTKGDIELVNNSYENFVNNLKTLLQSNNITTALECCKIINFLLRNGNFSQNNEIIFDSHFEFLSLSNVDNSGIYVMHGICCCRHISYLINDILKVLGFDSLLLYVFVDQEGNWHKLKTALGSNHVVVLLRDKEVQYLIDSMNNYLFKIDDDFGLEEIDFTVDSSCKNLFKNYEDSNTKDIGKILTKYYNMKNLGIDHVYDYSY